MNGWDRFLALLEKFMTFLTGAAVGHKLGEKERQELKADNMRLDLKQKELDIELQTERDFSGLSDDDAIAKSIERLRPKKPESE